MKKTIINIIGSLITTVVLSILLQFTGFETVMTLAVTNMLFEIQDIKKA